MAKRFTDTGKWDDPWFAELSNEHKLIWIYLLDKCDMAGIWKVNKKMLEFCVGFSVDLEVFLKAATDRINVHKDKWLVKKFINFQYGELTEANKVFRSVQSCLLGFEGNKGHLSPINGGKDKDKTKTSISKRQDKDTIPHKNGVSVHFEGCVCKACKK